MIIEFEAKQTFNQMMDIVEPGDTCIKCENESFEQWYLITKTIDGEVHCLEFGPVCPDVDMLIPGFYSTYTKLKFDEKKLFKKIHNFLNDPKKQISSAEEDFAENAYDDFPDLVDAFKDIT